MRPLAALSLPDLVALARALAAGRLVAPFARSEVGRYVGARDRGPVTGELQRLADAGMSAAQIALVLELLADEGERSQEARDPVDLVWSGPGVDGSATRATASVVRELFATAKRSVLVASYALDRPERAQALFSRLAERMDAEPELEVRLFVNVSRPYRSRASEAALLSRFAAAFAKEVWPGERLPDVFHDPRALDEGFGERACLHAKCVVIDDARALITSANFTEAAHERNIEAGALIDDPRLATALRQRFDALVRLRALVRVPGLSR